jgi:hypothetical protein
MAEWREFPAANSSAASLLPARHPWLRDIAIVFAIVSTLCYFALSEGVRSFVGFIMKILSRSVLASH